MIVWIPQPSKNTKFIIKKEVPQHLGLIRDTIKKNKKSPTSFDIED